MPAHRLGGGSQIGGIGLMLQYRAISRGLNACFPEDTGHNGGSGAMRTDIRSLALVSHRDDGR
jgi:hypothetical protein